VCGAWVPEPSCFDRFVPLNPKPYTLNRVCGAWVPERVAREEAPSTAGKTEAPSPPI